MKRSLAILLFVALSAQAQFWFGSIDSTRINDLRVSRLDTLQLKVNKGTFGTATQTWTLPPVFASDVAALFSIQIRGITSITSGNPTIIQVSPNLGTGYQNGYSVQLNSIVGVGCGILNGLQTITVTGVNTFTVPVNTIALVCTGGNVRGTGGGTATVYASSTGQIVLETGSTTGVIAACDAGPCQFRQAIWPVIPDFIGDGVVGYSLTPLAKVTITAGEIGVVTDVRPFLGSTSTATFLPIYGTGAHDLTTVDPSYPNLGALGLGMAYGTNAAPNTVRRPSILFSRRDTGNWTAGERAVSYNFRTESGSGNKEMFTIEGRQAGTTDNDFIPFTSRFVQESGVPATASGFASWLSADCFDADANCGGMEINTANDSGIDAAIDYFSSVTNRKYGLAIIGTAGGVLKKNSTALAIGTQNLASPWQMGIEFGVGSIDTGRPALLAPNDIPISSRNAADTAILNLLWADASNNTILNTGATGAIAFNFGGVEKARIELDTGLVQLGLGTNSPATMLHIYANYAGGASMFRVEQAGTGDAAIDFLLTAVQGWAIGIDNSDADSFVFSSAGGLGGSNAIKFTVGGIINIPGLAGAGVDFVCVDATGNLTRSNVACP